MEMNETINPSDLRGGGGWPREGKGGPQILYIEREQGERGRIFPYNHCLLPDAH